jgi:putative membrane protein
MNVINTNQQRGLTRLIIGISIVVPLLVALLLFLPFKLTVPVVIVSALPTLNAVINSATSLLLIGALVAIKRKNIALHKTLMLSAFGLGAIFLVSYVLYHSSAPSTVFGDLNHDGILDEQEAQLVDGSRGIYLFVLLSHILLAIVVLPFVLFALFNALADKIDRHKKIVKFAFPIWLYVSITGVVVYLMISPYYNF